MIYTKGFTGNFLYCLFKWKSYIGYCCLCWGYRGILTYELEGLNERPLYRGFRGYFWVIYRVTEMIMKCDDNWRDITQCIQLIIRYLYATATRTLCIICIHGLQPVNLFTQSSVWSSLRYGLSCFTTAPLITYLLENLNYTTTEKYSF